MPTNALYGYAPTTQVGTQASPLDVFYGLEGTGNKTTNKDLPQWLRALGMKGDAYAGGMLKPQIRYGFWYKNGKIHFADGTSYSAKKNKGGTYSYTDSTGKAVTYSPTDEQNAYNKKYKAATSDQSFFDKVKNTVSYENAGVKRLWEGIKDNPLTLLTDPARTPAGTWLHNTVTGDDLKPLTGQLGGHSRDDWYEGPTGYAKPLNQLTETIVGFYGGQGAANGLGNAFSGVGGASGGAAGGDLGIFSNGGVGGIGSVGQSNAGLLAGSGAIAGGAGVSGTAGGLGGGSGGAAGLGGGGNGMGWDWGQIINTGGALLGGYLESRGARDAADASAAGSAAAVAESRRQYDTSRADQMPWLEAGRGALARLQDPRANFTASPGYEFRRDEGIRDIGNTFSARGGAASGNALRRLAEVNSARASDEFGNWWNQQAGLAGIGQTSAQNLGALGANSAANIGNALQNGANARASGIVDSTNAYTGALADILANYNRYRAPNMRGG